MSTLPLTTIKSSSRKMPTLSVLIPFYCDNPSKLLSALLVQAQELRGIEILLYDDGTNAKLLALNMLRRQIYA